MLVLGANLPVMFVGWEGVGLCSYLLIGFWFKKPSAADAGKKAFVVNRIGDFGFIIGMLLIHTTWGTFDFVELAKASFVDIQQGIARRDLSAVQDRLTPQEYARLQAQCDQLRSARRTNRIERIQIGRAQLTEAWQESGQDWATVYFTVSLVDYTVDDSTGSVVEGSPTPVEVEEYWTFTRPVGPKPWRLSAIQTA